MSSERMLRSLSIHCLLKTPMQNVKRRTFTRNEVSSYVVVFVTRVTDVGASCTSVRTASLLWITHTVRSSWALSGAVSPLPSYENCLPLHFSTSGLTRPLAAATRWPRAGLIPTADPAGVTVVVHRKTAGNVTPLDAGFTGCSAGKARDVMKP